MVEPEMITVSEAAKRLGVSRVTMSRLVREGRFKVYANPLDRRERLVDWHEVEAAGRPQLLKDLEGKIAAC